MQASDDITIPTTIQIPNYRVVYWDSASSQQRERDATPDEMAEIDARKAQSTKPKVAQIVTMAQARLALLRAGLLGNTNTLVAGIPGTEGEAARTRWEFEANVRRDDPLLLILSVQLGLSQGQLDQLFIDANLL